MSVKRNALLTVRAKTDIIYVMLLRAGGFAAAFMQWQQGNLCGRGGMADTLVLGANASACGFKSHRPHQMNRVRGIEQFCWTVRYFVPFSMPEGLCLSAFTHLI